MAPHKRKPLDLSLQLASYEKKMSKLKNLLGAVLDDTVLNTFIVCLTYPHLSLAQLPPQRPAVLGHDAMPLARDDIGVVGVMWIANAPLRKISESYADMLAGN